jgi:hypothetical protein
MRAVVRKFFMVMDFKRSEWKSLGARLPAVTEHGGGTIEAGVDCQLCLRGVVGIELNVRLGEPAGDEFF